MSFTVYTLATVRTVKSARVATNNELAGRSVVAVNRGAVTGATAIDLELSSCITFQRVQRYHSLANRPPTCCINGMQQICIMIFHLKLMHIRSEVHLYNIHCNVIDYLKLTLQKFSK